MSSSLCCGNTEGDCFRGAICLHSSSSAKNCMMSANPGDSECGPVNLVLYTTSVGYMSVPEFGSVQDSGT